MARTVAFKPIDGRVHNLDEKLSSSLTKPANWVISFWSNRHSYGSLILVPFKGRLNEWPDSSSQCDHLWNLNQVTSLEGDGSRSPDWNLMPENLNRIHYEKSVIKNREIFRQWLGNIFRPKVGSTLIIITAFVRSSPRRKKMNILKIDRKFWRKKHFRSQKFLKRNFGKVVVPRKGLGSSPGHFGAYLALKN